MLTAIIRYGLIHPRSSKGTCGPVTRYLLQQQNVSKYDQNFSSGAGYASKDQNVWN
jgi:hypothetical protein